METGQMLARGMGVWMFDPRWSWVMTLLLVMSIIAIALVIERFIFFFRRKVDPNQFFRRVREAFKTGGISEALAMVRGVDAPHAHLVRTGLENYELPEDMLAELMESTILEQRIRLERFLSGLGTIGYVSPLLGLLGTVIGLIKAFTNIAVTGSGGPAVVSSGIAEALLTTAIGLVIAVPVIYFYNYFSKRATDTVDEMESVMRKFLQLVTASKGGGYEAAAPAGPASGA